MNYNKNTVISVLFTPFAFLNVCRNFDEVKKKREEQFPVDVQKAFEMGKRLSK